MKILFLFLLVLLAALLGGIYGALYDQITYSISPEFFTKFRFHNSGIDPSSSERIGAATVGFLNTWKTGLVIGALLSFAGLINKDHNLMFKYTLRAFILTLFIAFIAGMIGWSIGSLANQADPEASLGILDKEAFKTVVNMNNFGYAGGVIGMFLGIFYQLYKHRINKLKQSEMQ
jgi:hypothetical protein